MEYLSPLDSGFLDADDEDRHASLAMASVATVEGPVPSQEEFLHLVPLDLDRPRAQAQTVDKMPPPVCGLM